MKNNKLGFSLIELLVVISIIGILSTLAVVSFNEAKKKAEQAQSPAYKTAEQRKENCIKDNLNCQNKCADSLLPLEDCLKRCNIKLDVCNSK